MSLRWLPSRSAAGWGKPTGRGTAHARDVGLRSSTNASLRSRSSCRAPGTSLLLRQHWCCSMPETVLRLPEMSNCSKAVWTWRSFSSCSAPIMQFICSCSPSPTSFMDSCRGKKQTSSQCLQKPGEQENFDQRAGELG